MKCLLCLRGSFGKGKSWPEVLGLTPMKRLLTWDIEKDMASAILQKDQAKQRLDKKAKPDNQKKRF